MNLHFNHKRHDLSAAQLRDDAHDWGTVRMEYSAQWVTALTEAAVATGVMASDLDDEVWAQLQPGAERSVTARKAILAAVVSELGKQQKQP